MPQGQPWAWKLEVADNRRAPPAHARDPDKIGDQRADDAQADQAIGERMEMIDVGDRIRRRQEPRADHERHAKPERDSGHGGQTGDLPGGEPCRSINPIANRSPGHQRKPKRERKRVARERRDRRQPVGNLDLKVTKRECVIAGERKVAQRREGEGEQELVAARSGNRGLELIGIDAEDRVDKDRQRAGDDDEARGQAKPTKRRTVTRNGVDQTIDECRRLWGRRFDRRPV